jgi:PKD repeat protein
MSGEATLVSSPGINQDFSCPSQNGHTSSSCRWGDYAGASTDPISCAVWGTNELNGATSVGNASWASENFSLLTDECPVAKFTFSPTSPVHGQPVSFDGSTSSDADGTLSFTWNWGDGSPNGTGVTTMHTFATAGAKSVTLTVKDSTGQTASVIHTITVS